MYDALLTNERLILMDSRYTRFEPRMIHFSAISSVKGGKVPTGDPVIILTLDEPDDVSGSVQVDLIFTQQPGEQRREERERWVRKLIDLVISAREQALQIPVPFQEKTGLHPTIRRWVAPEPARPHTSVEKSTPPPQRVAATPDETDLPVFNREDLPPEPEIPPPAGETAGSFDEEPVFLAQDTPVETSTEVPVPGREVRDEIPGAEHSSVPEDSGLYPRYEDIAVKPAVEEQTEEPANPGEPSISYTNTLRSVLISQQSRGGETNPPEAGTPVLIETGEPEEPAAAETPVPKSPPAETDEHAEDGGWAKDHGIPENHRISEEPTIPDPDQHQEPGTGDGPVAIEPTGEIPDSPVLQVHGLGLPEEPQEPKPPLQLPADNRQRADDRGIPEEQKITPMPPTPDTTDLHEEHGAEPGTGAGEPADGIPDKPVPDIPVPAPREVPHDPNISSRQPVSPTSARTPVPKRTVITAIVLVLIAILVLSGGIVLLSHYLQDNDSGIPTAIMPSTVTVTQTPTPVPPETIPSGVRVDVIYPGMFTGTIGNPGFLHPVSGSGNRTFAILMTSDIVQATIQKQDYSGDVLTVGIYNNSTLLAEKTVTAPMGEINLLIDTKTSSPPGMTPDTVPAGNRTRIGNGTLVYL